MLLKRFDRDPPVLLKRKQRRRDAVDLTAWLPASHQCGDLHPFLSTHEFQ
jgi:hypothetical protein